MITGLGVLFAAITGFAILLAFLALYACWEAWISGHIEGRGLNKRQIAEFKKKWNELQSLPAERNRIRLIPDSVRIEVLPAGALLDRVISLDDARLRWGLPPLDAVTPVEPWTCLFCHGHDQRINYRGGSECAGCGASAGRQPEGDTSDGHP